MERYTITVSGKVQGMFFRQSAKEVAQQLNLTGFARNESDGSVYIEIEGEPIALEEFLTWCRQGPRLATVKNMKHVKQLPVGHSEFKIY